MRFAASLDVDQMTPAEFRIILADLQMTKSEARRYILRAQAIWNQSVLNSAEYASMVRANFPNLLRA